MRFIIQCLTEAMSRLYMENDLYHQGSFMGNHCLHAANTPCWVPQIKDIINSSVQNNLKVCPSIRDYYCELVVLHHAAQMAASECNKPCQRSQYRLLLDREITMSDTHGLGDTFFSLWFSTNTIMQYKEVLVVKLKLQKIFNHEYLTRDLFMQIMDVPTIVGSVGGSLGLFLGFSCLATAQSLLRKV